MAGCFFYTKTLRPKREVRATGRPEDKIQEEKQEKEPGEPELSGKDLGSLWVNQNIQG